MVQFVCNVVYALQSPEYMLGKVRQRAYMLYCITFSFVIFETGSLADSEGGSFGQAGMLASQYLESVPHCSIMKLQSGPCPALLYRYWIFPDMLVYQMLLPTESLPSPVQHTLILIAGAFFCIIFKTRNLLTCITLSFSSLNVKTCPQGRLQQSPG